MTTPLILDMKEVQVAPWPEGVPAYFLTAIGGMYRCTHVVGSSDDTPKVLALNLETGGTDSWSLSEIVGDELWPTLEAAQAARPIPPPAAEAA